MNQLLEWLLFKDTALTKMISIALLIFPGLGLALLGCKTVAELPIA